MRAPLLLLALVLPALAEEEEPALVTTDSGLQYQVLRAGRPGTEPPPGTPVVVHYTGWLLDGTKFDSSLDRDEPLRFVVGKRMVIPGWDEGLGLMTEGSKYRFTIPPELAYGKRPPPGSRIPPDATLVFEVELLRRAPAYRAVDPEAQGVTESGLKYQMLVEGAGEPPRADQGVSVRYALWRTDGTLLECTEQQGHRLAGPLSLLSLDFFQEAVRLMKPGAVCLLEVPPELCFGARAMGEALPPNSVTVWQLELEAVNDIPAFAKLDPEKAQQTASGLRYEVVREGEGQPPGKFDKVTVQYTTWLSDGKVVDSSHATGEPRTLPLGKLIPGWREGLQLMKPGAVYRFEVPGNLAYGNRPPPGSPIPPNATLVYLVELYGTR